MLCYVNVIAPSNAMSNALSNFHKNESDMLDFLQ